MWAMIKRLIDVLAAELLLQAERDKSAWAGNRFEDQLTLDGTFHLEPLARAVLEALREPTEAMEEASRDLLVVGWDPSHATVWQAMIDAALATGRTG